MACRYYRVLIVDDDLLMLNTLAAALAGGPYEVSTAVNGKIAMEKMETEAFDLVITDIFMPETDGLELTRLLHVSWPEIKIIALSDGARGLTDFLRAAREFGADAVLRKPFLVTQFRDAVLQVLTATTGTNDNLLRC